ncbi:hypothetical protein SRHO_G00072970 [Serrasalmus rhombeus]
MGGFTLCGRVLCWLLWGSPLALIGPLNLSVLAAESSQTKPPSFLFLREKALDGLGYFSALSLAAKFPEDLEITEDCLKLLHVFGQRYVDLVNCLVSSARPVEVCQNCYGAYSSFNETYSNITSDTMGPKNESCQESLMHSDRLMLLYSLYSSLQDIWESADCTSCLTKDHKSLLNSTLNFISSHNSTLSCFEKYKGNHSELCTECKVTYKRLNELYSNLEKNGSLCIDIEDAMNVTRRLWSKNFDCSVLREEAVPVIAVSSFMLFLPVIFYLSNFLHSEQKKRKLIHPKRAKSNHSLMNIQDKFS